MSSDLFIRRYLPGEEAALWQLKFATIRQINCRDYSPAQCAAWAPDDLDPALWQQRVQGMNPWVALLDGEIAGFADLQADGYIDHFFCAAHCQGRGVGRALMQQLMAVAQARGLSRLYSHVSLTARPFFEHCGFVVRAQQEVSIRAVTLTNFVMEYQCGPGVAVPAAE